MRLRLLSALARVFRIQFHVDGFPYGAERYSPPGVSGSTGP